MSDQASEKRLPEVPKPILDDREYEELDRLTERYEKLMEPGPVGKAVKKVGEIVPAGIKDKAAGLGNAITEQEVYEQALKLISKGFKALEEQAARVTVSENRVIKGINAVSSEEDIQDLEEVCRIRAYDVSKAANASYRQHYAAALAEGAGTGVAGFAGIPANLVLSTFVYYRAVQSIALCYGYDVKNDPSELVIASEVFANALSPASKDNEGVSGTIAKIMTISAAEGVKQAAKKGWAAMIEHGGPALILAQMRALANGAAKKALERAGQKGLENSVFREVFEQIGRRLTLKVVQRAVPVVSAGIGAFIDTAQMDKVLQYADVFYHKRFLLEKESRVKMLYGIGDEPAAEAIVLDEVPVDDDDVTETDDVSTVDEPLSADEPEYELEDEIEQDSES